MCLHELTLHTRHQLIHKLHTVLCVHENVRRSCLQTIKDGFFQKRVVGIVIRNMCCIQETNDRVCLARSGRTLNQCELCLGLELCSGGGCSKDRTELRAVVSVLVRVLVSLEFGCDLEV